MMLYFLLGLFIGLGIGYAKCFSSLNKLRNELELIKAIKRKRGNAQVVSKK